MADVMFQHLTRKVFVQMFNDSKSLLVVTYVEQCCVDNDLVRHVIGFSKVKV